MILKIYDKWHFRTYFVKVYKARNKSFSVVSYFSQQHAIIMPLFYEIKTYLWWDRMSWLIFFFFLILGYKNSYSLSNQILLTTSAPPSYIRDRIPPSYDCVLLWKIWHNWKALISGLVDFDKIRLTMSLGIYS